MIATPRRRQPRLGTLQQRFERWRQTRRHPRAPLPARLWAAAVALVPEHGLYATARALGVSYGALKRHVERPGAEPREVRRARFVELPPAPVADGYLIEIAQSAGLTVRIRLKGLTPSAVADFTRRVVGVAS